MQRMGTKARMAAAFLLALLITAVYFAFAYTRMPFIYDINDDVAMRNVRRESLPAPRTPI